MNKILKSRCKPQNLSFNFGIKLEKGFNLQINKEVEITARKHEAQKYEIQFEIAKENDSISVRTSRDLRCQR